MINRIAEKVKRDASPLRRSFVERKEGSDTPTPLARLLRTQGDFGGKGGGLRISLFLSLIWVCARSPYETRRVAPYWAELLGREDPRGEGARTIRDCLKELEARALIGIRPDGAAVEISLNHEASTPDHVRAYEAPYDSGDAYLSVPRSFWTSQLAGSLSGAAVAMYLAGLALTSHERFNFFVSAAFFDARFGISRSSRKRGLKELTDRGVLTVETVETVDVDTFRVRRRNVYTIQPDFRQPKPWKPEEQEAEEKPGKITTGSSSKQKKKENKRGA